MIIGADGLGSPAALYLAGAGIGTIGIMDADKVSISNLQRQIIHSTENIGLNKAESAKQTLEKLNDKITVRAYPHLLTSENAEEIIRACLKNPYIRQNAHKSLSALSKILAGRQLTYGFSPSIQ